MGMEIGDKHEASWWWTTRCTLGAIEVDSCSSAWIWACLVQWDRAGSSRTANVDTGRIYVDVRTLVVTCLTRRVREVKLTTGVCVDPPTGFLCRSRRVERVVPCFLWTINLVSTESAVCIPGMPAEP